MSTVVTLGPVGYNPTGTYDPTKAYERLDVVYYQGSSYVATANSIGQLPTNSEYWDCIAEGVDTSGCEVKSNKVTSLSNLSTDVQYPSAKCVYDHVKTIPTKTSDLTNDSNFVSDSSYVHTDNNYTTSEKTQLSGLTNVAKTNVNNNFSTAQTINGNLTVAGDISQTGTTYETHAEQLYTAKDIIKTRDGAVGGLGNNEVTGIEALLYDGTNNGRLVFDNTGTARVGDTGDEVPLCARDEATNMTNGYVMTWDSTDLEAKTSFALVTLSQDDYDDLVTAGTVDSNTYYFTTEEE